MSNQIRGKRNDRRGAALVEFVIFLPIITLMVMATVEACSMIYLKQSLSIAAYEGGRTALIPGIEPETVTNECYRVVNDRSLNGAQVTINPNDIGATPVGNYIRVEVSAPCASNAFFGSWFYQGKTLLGAAEVMKEY